jgi:hypothetical protein
MAAAQQPILSALVAHCDWSISDKKRWMAVARLDGVIYELDAPVRVEVATVLIDSLRTTADIPGPLLFGFDFPIGLPYSYGCETKLESFRKAIQTFGSDGLWSRWFEVVDDKKELTIHRPFYPAKSGGRRQSHLLEALNVGSINELRRHCELSSSSRRAACPLFWTLGGNQVGKAAIAGWRDVLIPALRLNDVSLWPFDGGLSELLSRSRVALAETYPAEAYSHVGVKFTHGMSKRRQADRASAAPAVVAWAKRRNVALKQELVSKLCDGFGQSPEGEDMFDAVLGLAGMLEVVMGHRGEGAPASERVRRWEGWILGQCDFYAGRL